MSSLLYGPVLVSAPDCPVKVAAGRVRHAREPASNTFFASGWGSTEEEAARGCRYEADETHFAQCIPSQGIICGRADELPIPVIEPPALMLFSDAQYRERSQAPEADPRHRVPPPWLRPRPLDWLRSDAALGAVEVGVPARLCLLDYPGDAGSGLPAADSNGLATGSSLEEACARAFSELVERDATAIWWYNKLVLPGLDVVSLADDLISAYGAWSKSGHRELRLLRLTLDIPIPIVAAITCDGNGRQPAMGFAAGSSTRSAARGAVGELAQCEANLRLLCQSANRSGTDAFTLGARRLYQWHRDVSVHAHPFLQGSGIAEELDEELTLDWGRCKTLAHSLALQPIVVDLTDPRGPPLVRVFVPSLRSTKPRLKRGRLFDVPKTLGMKASDARSMAGEPFPF